MTKRKLAIISATGFARAKHIPTYKSLDDFDLVACCDVNAEALKETCDRFDIPGRYSSVDDMLKREHMDIVCIVTDPRGHIPLARKCVEAGRHVLVEKPLSEDYREIREFLAFLEGRKERVIVSQNYRWQNPALEMKSVLDAGHIGAPYWLDITIYNGTRSPAVRDGVKYKSPFVNIGVHEVDLARFLIGREVASVFAPRLSVSYAADVKYPFTDIMVNFEGGGVASIRMDWTGRGFDEWIRLRIEGTQAVALCDYDSSPDVFVHRLGADPVRFHREGPPDSIPRVLRHLVDCIQSGRQPDTWVGDNIRTMEIVLGAYLSCSEGRVVKFPQDRERLVQV